MSTLSRLFIHGFVVAALAVVPALAQDDQELTGTLKKVKDSGTITIGYREASLPFSYLDAKGRPIGYSLALCFAIVEEVKARLDTDRIDVKFIPVKSQDRISYVVNGTIDLECGSTTNTRARQNEVAFSPVIFVTGTKLLVKRSSKIRSYRDLKNKTVAVSAGTTNEMTLKKLSDKELLDIHLLSTRDLADAFEEFAAGHADAFATDEVLLFGFLAKVKNPEITWWSAIIFPTSLTASAIAGTIGSSRKSSNGRFETWPRAASLLGSMTSGSSGGFLRARDWGCG